MINEDKISKFNISGSHLWEGALTPSLPEQNTLSNRQQHNKLEPNLSQQPKRLNSIDHDQTDVDQ